MARNTMASLAADIASLRSEVMALHHLNRLQVAEIERLQPTDKAKAYVGYILDNEELRTKYSEYVAARKASGTPGTIYMFSEFKWRHAAGQVRV